MGRWNVIEQPVKKKWEVADTSEGTELQNDVKKQEETIVPYKPSPTEAFKGFIRRTAQTLRITETPEKARVYDVKREAWQSPQMADFWGKLEKTSIGENTKLFKGINEWGDKMAEKYPYWFGEVPSVQATGDTTTRAFQAVQTIASLGMVGILGANVIQGIAQTVQMNKGLKGIENITSNLPKIERILAQKGINLPKDMSSLDKIKVMADMTQRSPILGTILKTASMRPAQVPIPYVVGQMVKFGDQVGKIVNITEKAAQILTAAGQTISANLSQLKPSVIPPEAPKLPVEFPIAPKVAEVVKPEIPSIGEEPPKIPPTDVVGFEGPEGEGANAVVEYEVQKDIWIGNKDVRVLQSKIEQRALQKETSLALGKTKYDAETQGYDRAMQLYIDTQRNPEHIDKYYDKLTPEQKKTVDLSQKLPDNIKAMAVKISDSYKALGIEALDAEVIRNVLDNYAARVWKIEGKKGMEKFRKFGVTTRHAKARRFETILEGWANGFELKVEGATTNLQILKEEMVKTIEDKKFLKTLQKMKTLDGEPLLSTQQLEGYKKVEHPNFKVWKYAGKAPEVEATGKVYGRNFFRDEEGNLFERRDLYAPKEQADNLNNILGISKLKGIPAIDFVTKWNAVVKAWILQSSFFHHLAFMRSYYFGTNHKQWDEMSVRQAYRQGVKAIDEENPIVMLGVKNGLTLGVKQDWDEEILRETSKLDTYLDKIRVVGATKNKVLDLRRKHVDFLFGEFGAGLKAKSFMVEYRNMLKKYPGKSTDEIAKMVANLINDDFGGLHLQRLGRDPTVQHVFRLFALAPDWTESNVRTMVKAFKAGSKEETNLYRRFWAGIFTKGAILTVLGNALMAGLDEDTKEAKGWYKRMIRNYKLAWKAGRMRWMDIDITALYKMLGGKTGNRKYFSVLGHFKDPIKFITHPIRSIHHKGSIIYGTLHEALTGVDWAGRRFTTAPELFGFDTEKGRYKTTRRGYYRKGDPKWGRLTGKTVTWDFKGKGPLNYNQIISYAISQAKGATPVQIQNLLAWLAGEMEGFDAFLKSGGLRVSTTYDKPGKKKKKGSKWKVN